MSRFAPGEFVEVLSGHPGWQAEVCPGRFRKGFMWATRGSMRRFALDGFVKVLSGRPGVADGDLLRAIP